MGFEKREDKKERTRRDLTRRVIGIYRGSNSDRRAVNLRVCLCRVLLVRPFLLLTILDIEFTSSGRGISVLTITAGAAVKMYCMIRV